MFIAQVSPSEFMKVKIWISTHALLLVRKILINHAARSNLLVLQN
jgi:hypothetical protein